MEVYKSLTGIKLDIWKIWNLSLLLLQYVYNLIILHQEIESSHDKQHVHCNVVNFDLKVLNKGCESGVC